MKSFMSRRDSIILSAIDIIYELGIQGLSTKEIAAREGIAESALYRHFKGKDEIIAAVLEHYCQFDKAIINSIKKKDMVSREKIIYYIKSYMEYYENYPAITSIQDSYEILIHDNSAGEMVRRIYRARFENLRGLIVEGQLDGDIGVFFTAEEMAQIINGFVKNMVFEWRTGGCDFPLKERVKSTLEKMLSRC